MKIYRYILAVFCSFSMGAYAGVMPSQSRIIYNSDDKDASIMLANTNDYPVIVQTWVDKGEGTPDVSDVPFISMPPVFYLEPRGVKGVRILYNKTKLPQEKESLFWFNIYEMAPESKVMTPDNSVRVTMNTQIKLFYRPHNIDISPDKAVKNLTCKLNSRKSILCYNASPIHISVTDFRILSSEGNSVKPVNANDMLTPFSKTTYHFQSGFTPSKVSIQYIDDSGNKLNYTLNLEE